MWSRFYQRMRVCVGSFGKVCMGGIACVLLIGSAVTAQSPNSSLANLLIRYGNAMTDIGASRLTRFEIFGTISGAGLQGTYHIRHDGDDERLDQNLGLRRERQIRLGTRYFFVDESGDVREYHGLLLRHARTEQLIASGDLPVSPYCCRLLGTAMVAGRSAYVLAVAADAGDTETLFLDAEKALPLRIVYDQDDGQTTVDLSDWRTVNGHRFAFRSVMSDGSHAYDITQATTSVVVGMPINANVFSVPQSRQIETSGVRHVPLVEHAGHFFVPVGIGTGAYLFLLDSGAQDILLDERVAHALGLQEEGALEASGAQRTGGLRLAKLRELRIGGAVMRDLIVAVLDLGVSTRGAFHIDGILGYPFFASSVVRMDFLHDRIDFGLPGSISTQGDYIDIDLDRGLSEAMLTADGVRAPFMIDTGNAAELLLYRPFVELHPGIVPTTLADMRSYGLGGSTDSYRSLLHQLTLGTVTLSDVNVGVMLATQGAFADRFDAGNVGIGILRKFIVTFDYPEDALYLQRQ
jgi:Aspartyl protease